MAPKLNISKLVIMIHLTQKSTRLQFTPLRTGINRGPEFPDRVKAEFLGLD